MANPHPLSDPMFDIDTTIGTCAIIMHLFDKVYKNADLEYSDAEIARKILERMKTLKEVAMQLGSIKPYEEGMKALGVQFAIWMDSAIGCANDREGGPLSFPEFYDSSAR